MKSPILLKQCPLCNKKNVPYILIENKAFDRDYEINFTNKNGEPDFINEKGRVKVSLFGCPDCKQLYIEDNVI